jgi:hypothetical protein
MANGRSQIDLGFAEFAAQLVAELHEAVLAAQAGQDDRRTELANLATMRAEQFARRYVTEGEIDAELARLFPGRGLKGHRVRVGMRYAAVTNRKAEAPPIQTRLAIRLGRADLRSRSGRRAAELTASGVKTIRDAVRLRLSEARLRPLRQMATQGMPRVVVDSGHVNVKLNFRLVDLDKMGVRNGKDAAVVSLKPLTGMIGGKDGNRLKSLRLVVRQVNAQTTPAPPATAASGIGELELTFKTV